jgi:DNA (cytosine-5)-methyltransferase 1
MEPPTQYNEITFADMFSGIGGFRLGIENAAKRLEIPVKCVFSSEIEKNARFVYETNFKETPSGDITKIRASDIPEFNILCGGFPCQDVSIAGKREGLKGKRTGLFFDVIRILQEKQPSIVFLENVKGLLSSNGGWDFARVLIELEDTGYSVEWDILNSKDFGVPQNRERVFIIGHLRGGRTRQIFPVFGETGETVRENIRNCIDSNYFKGIDNHGEMTHIMCYPVLTPDRMEKRQTGRRIKNADEPMFTLTAQDKHGVLIQHYCGSHQQDRVLDPSGISSCLPTGTGGGLIPKFCNSYKNYVDDTFIEFLIEDAVEIEYKSSSLITLSDGRRFERETLDDGSLGKWYENVYRGIRKLTPTECERLQGFPDNWTAGVSDTARYKCLGNSVTVNVIEAIAERILKGFYNV